jgi:hypothetical protein
MGKIYTDRCVEIIRPHPFSKHTIHKVQHKKGIPCASCGEPHPKELHQCGRCDQIWCRECWTQTRKQVRPQLILVLIDANPFSSLKKTAHRLCHVVSPGVTVTSSYGWVVPTKGWAWQDLALDDTVLCNLRRGGG